jgi:hypothetical protein
MLAPNSNISIMNLPCKHTEIQCNVGEPYRQGMCRPCWLALNDAEYAELYDAELEVAKKKEKPIVVKRQVRPNITRKCCGKK